MQRSLELWNSLAHTGPFLCDSVKEIYDLELWSSQAQTAHFRVYGCLLASWLAGSLAGWLPAGWLAGLSGFVWILMDFGWISA